MAFWEQIPNFSSVAQLGKIQKGFGGFPPPFFILNDNKKLMPPVPKTSWQSDKILQVTDTFAPTYIARRENPFTRFMHA